MKKMRRAAEAAIAVVQPIIGQLAVLGVTRANAARQFVRFQFDNGKTTVTIIMQQKEL
jgi:hypothetical protein